MRIRHLRRWISDKRINLTPEVGKKQKTNHSFHFFQQNNAPDKPVIISLCTKKQRYLIMVVL